MRGWCGRDTVTLSHIQVRGGTGVDTAPDPESLSGNPADRHLMWGAAGVGRSALSALQRGQLLGVRHQLRVLLLQCVDVLVRRSEFLLRELTPTRANVN